MALIRRAPPLAVKISDCIRMYWPLSLLKMSHYSIFLLHHLIMRRRDVALTCMEDDAHMPAFACALYMWQVDGSPLWQTPPVIRTQMALQWLIIDAANMWQVLINTHAGWIAQTRTALTIHWKLRGVRRQERKRRGGRGEEENCMLAAKVHPHTQYDIAVACRWQRWIVSIIRARLR